jgi:hypothetical protein
MTDRWVVKLEEDPATGDLIMPLPTDLLNQVGWDFGDTLIWEDMQDGRWSLKKKDDGTIGDATDGTGGSNSSTVDKNQ